MDGHLPVTVAREKLRRLGRLGLIKMNGDMIESTATQRLELAMEAVKLGADIERVCRFLGWQEFENFAILALGYNLFETQKHFRFKWANRWWEIDILGFKEPLILSVDCKHWKRSWQHTAIMRIVDAQIKRAKSFSQALPKIKGKIGIAKWREVEIMPVILTLGATPFKFYKQVPIVPIFQFRSFINELPAFVNCLATFRVKLRCLK
jgi:hypothetical protein